MRKSALRGLLGLVLTLACASCVEAQPTGLQPLQERPFITAQNPLEEALLVFVREPTPETEAAMGNALLTTTVFLKVDAEAAVALQNDSDARPARVNIWMVTLPDGRNALALYTSLERLKSAFADQPEIPWVSMTGAAALALARPDQPVALNWGVDPHVYWGPDLTAQLLD